MYKYILKGSYAVIHREKAVFFPAANFIKRS